MTYVGQPQATELQKIQLPLCPLSLYPWNGLATYSAPIPTMRAVNWDGECDCPLLEKAVLSISEIAGKLPTSRRNSHSAIWLGAEYYVSLYSRSHHVCDIIVI